MHVQTHMIMGLRHLEERPKHLLRVLADGSGDEQDLADVAAVVQQAVCLRRLGQR
jgi:hypothetical protein